MLDRLEALLAHATPPAGESRPIAQVRVSDDAALLAAAVNALPALIACTRALERIRQWDVLNGYIGPDGEQHESTGDAPYWRAELDRALARLAEGEPQP